MKSLLSNKKVLLWDFDGVIIDSNVVRELGFKKIFATFDATLVNELLKFHNKNGGLSRYVKIRYFYEEILKMKITDAEITKLADEFSSVMRNELVKKKYLIEETVKYIESVKSSFTMHIVSGSDQEELRFLCNELDVAKFFLSIHGSPTHKNDLVKNLISSHQYNTDDLVLIGDSINDYEAAKINGIDFIGYNNTELNNYGFYLESFTSIKL
jgi:phosphoglycolate phosphatase-like HAD superfamily hydrolase